MIWEWRQFENIYEAPSRNGVYKPKEFHGNGAKIVNMGELFAHDFIGHQKMSRLEMSDAEIEKSGLHEGDLLFGRRSLVEEGAGKCSLVSRVAEDTTFESSIIRVRLQTKVCNPRFYYYWFKSRLGRGSIKAIVTGTNVKGIRGSDLRKVLVPVPELKEQNKLVSLFSTYDELIENNQRRIVLLEDAARQLYKEWFVRFRFPGHEHVRYTDGTPEGWETKTLFDCVDVLSGGTPKTTEPEYWNGEIPFFTPKDTGDGPYVSHTEKMITETGLKRCNSKLYDKGTIFVTARGTVGKVRLAQRPMAMNQSCYAIRSSTQLTQSFLYFAVCERVNHLKARAGGAVFDAIVVDTFKKIPFVLPDNDLANTFSKFAERYLKQIDLLSCQIEQLTQARDLLLPKLMSGEIAV